MLKPIELQSQHHESYELGDGLRLVYQQRPHGNAFIGLCFDAGSMAGSPGLAHFAEHMFFQTAAPWDDGMETMPAEDYLKQIAPQVGAATCQHGMVFSGTVLADDAGEFVRRLVQVISGFTVSEDRLRAEKQVIHNEYLRDQDNQQRKVAWDLAFNLLDEHPYATPILGTLDDIHGVTQEQLHQFVRQSFSASNLTVIYVGPHSMDELKDICADLDLLGSGMRATLPAPDCYLSGRTSHVPAQSKSQRMQINFPIEQDLLPRSMEKYVTGILGAQMFSDLRQKGLVYDANVSFRQDGDAKSLSVDFQTAPETIEDCLKIVCDHLQRLQHGTGPGGFDGKHAANIIHQFAIDNNTAAEQHACQMFHYLCSQVAQGNDPPQIAEFYKSHELAEIDAAAKTLYGAMMGTAPNVFAHGPRSDFPNAEAIAKRLGITALPCSEWKSRVLIRLPSE